MSESLGSAVLDLSTDDSKLAQGLGDAEGTTKSRMGRIAGTMAKGAAVGAAALAAAGAAAFGAANKVAGMADEIDKASTRMGVGTEAFQNMEFWASQNGVSMGALEKSVGRLNQRIGDGTAGSSKYVDALNGLGVATLDSSGHARDAESVFRDTIAALSGVESETEKAAIAQEIFGTKTSRDLLPALQDGSLSLEEATAKAQELGLVMSQEAIDAGVRFTDQWDQIKRTVGAFLRDAAVPLMTWFSDSLFPILTETVLPTLRRVVDAFGEDGLSGAFAAMGDMFDGDSIMDTLGGLLASILDWITTSVPQILEFLLAQREAFFDAALRVFEAIVDALPQIIPQVVTALVGMVTSLVQALVTAVPLLLAGAVQLFTGLVQALVTVLPDVLAGVLDILDGVLTALLDALPLLVEAGIELLSGLLDGLLTALPQIISFVVSDLIPGLLDTVIDLLPQVLESGIELLLALLDGLLDALPEIIGFVVGDLIPTLIETAVDLIPLIIQAGIDLLLGLLFGLLDALPEIIDFVISDLIPTLIETAIDLIPLLIKAGIQLLVGILTGLVQALPQIIGFVVTDLIPSVFMSLIGALGQMNKAGSEWLRGMLSGLVDQLPKVIRWFRELPGKLLKAVGKLNKLLAGKARELIMGFVDGIRNMFGNVKDTLGNLTSKLTSWKGPRRVDVKLLTEPAEWIMEGFADSLTASAARMVQPALAEVSADIGLPGAAGSGGVSRTFQLINHNNRAELDEGQLVRRLRDLELLYG